MIDCTEVNGILVVEMKGISLDARTAKDFRREIEPQLDSHAKVVLDLSQMTFVDSSGLGFLLSCLRQVSSKGGDMKLSSLTSQVRSVF
jgi:anti-sigma B factor antagonist